MCAAAYYISPPFMTDGFDCAAAAGLEPVRQPLQICSCDSGQQRLGQLGLILAPNHKVLVLEVTHILITQILHVRQTVRDRLISFVMALSYVLSSPCVMHVRVVPPQKAWGR